jgi:hypothetical protein
MTSLRDIENHLKSLETIFRGCTQFISKVSEKYEIDIEELNDLFSSAVGVIDKMTTTEKTTTTGDFCHFILTRGDNKGTQCKKKPVKGDVFCASHKKKESDVNMKEAVKQFQVVKFKGLFWNKETRFVFVSREDQTVYGKLDNNNEDVLPLSDKDIEICNKLKLKYKDKDIVTMEDVVNELKEEELEEEED